MHGLRELDSERRGVAELPPCQAQTCAYTKAAYLLNRYPSPGAVDPDVDPNIVGTSGIFQTAEYQASSDFQKTAAVMKLVIDGDAAAGTIELGGFDYHTGDRATGETRDFSAGQCIGAVLQYAAIQGKPVMIYIFSDGSLASDGTIDNSVGGPRQGRVDGRQPERRGHLLPGLRPEGQADARAEQSRDEPAARLLQSGRLAEHDRSPAGNNVPNLVQMVVLNYMALHSANDLARLVELGRTCGRPSRPTTRSARGAPRSIR